MLPFLKILGVITAIVITAILIVLNSTPAHVDFYFAKTDTAVFLVIMASFVLGFICCYILMSLRSLKNRKKTQKYSQIRAEKTLMGEI
ncbi:MAG: LapA family protein [Candidatus Magnetomorum sp.]|nr:LapA family protein [Candidatus Magnetomorum sp.]